MESNERRDYAGMEPPQSREAEVFLIGGVLQDADALNQVVQTLVAEDFYDQKHQRIYEALLQLHAENAPVDIITVSDRLQKDDALANAGGREYLLQLMESVASAANVAWHAKIIKQKSMLRALITSSNQSIRMALDPSAEPIQVLEQAERGIFQIAESQLKNSLRHVTGLVQDVLRMIDTYRRDNLSGTPSGFRDLDSLTNGLQPSDLIILAGRPAMGKTAFALSLATNAAVDHGKRVAFFSLEMGAEQLVQRIICSRAQIDMNDLRTGKLRTSDFPKIPAAAQPLMQSQLYIDDQPNLSITELRSKCRSLARKGGLDLVVVDYLQLMETGGEENRSVAIGNISRGLKILAKELKVPVLSLAQLSRKAEDPGRKGRPMLSDLRESGSIEQDADMVWFVHRPYYYNKEDERGPHYAELMVVKHRNGPTDDIKLTFIPHFATFYNYEQESNDPVNAFKEDY